MILECGGIRLFAVGDGPDLQLTAFEFSRHIASHDVLAARRYDEVVEIAVTAGSNWGSQWLRLLMADPVDATEELVTVRHAIYHQPDFVANIDNQ